MIRFSTTEKLRIQFRKEAASNAELDPAIPACVTALAEPGERFIVKVIRNSSGHYWFSDRRLLQEADGAASVIVEYGRIQQTHWMMHAIGRRMAARSAAAVKRAHFHRIELEVEGGELVALDGLGDAYWPALQFFWWITQPHVKIS